jgi:uncharacterized delta-60 repeat protein
MPARPPSFRPQIETLEARDVPSFGNGGFVSTDLAHTTDGGATAVALQADGKIVAAGTGGLLRYNADGSLDATFNAGGAQPGVVPIADWVTDVALQGDGKILVGGSRIIKEYRKSGPDRAFLLMRFNPNGTPDTTFGAGGTVVQAFGKSTNSDALRSLAVQPDGKIVAVGLINSNGWGNTNPDVGNWGVARFNANGSLDTSFDGDGFLSTVITANKSARVEEVAVQADGRIVAAGTVQSGAPTYADMAVVRYLANGALDTGFGTGGRVKLDFTGEHQVAGASTDEAHALAIQADGRIVVGGYEMERRDGLLARLNPNGTPDATFGGNGLVTVPGPSYTSNGVTYSPGVYFVDLAVQADGRIVAWSPFNADANLPAAVVRVNADGSLDTTFSDDGVAYFAWPGGTQQNPNTGGMVIQPDGKIVVAGGHYDSAGSYFDLARLNADGTFDS